MWRKTNLFCISRREKSTCLEMLINEDINHFITTTFMRSNEQKMIE